MNMQTFDLGRNASWKSLSKCWQSFRALKVDRKILIFLADQSQQVNSRVESSVRILDDSNPNRQILIGLRYARIHWFCNLAPQCSCYLGRDRMFEY